MSRNVRDLARRRGGGMRPRTWRPVCTAAVQTIVLLACTGDNGTGPGSKVPAIHLGVNPAMVLVEQGSSGFMTVSLTRVGGFSGVVTLAVTGLLPDCRQASPRRSLRRNFRTRRRPPPSISLWQERSPQGPTPRQSPRRQRGWMQRSPRSRLVSCGRSET